MSSEYLASALIFVETYIPTLFIYIVIAFTLFGLFVKMIRNDGTV